MNAVDHSPLSIHPADAPLGARIDGVDLRSIDSRTFDAIVAALGRYGVVCISDQSLDDDTFIAFSQRFGAELDIHALTQFAKPGHPEIFVLSNIVEEGRPLGASDAAQYWHSDLSYTRTPSRVSLLYAARVPHGAEGEPLGDTEFTSTVQAWNDLDAATKSELSKARAFHDAKKPKPRPGSHFTRPLSQDVAQRLDQVSHPVMRTHRDTGAKCLYVNEGFTTAIEGMPPERSDALLHELFVHMTQPQRLYRHRWRVHDLLIWDNCLTVHQGVPNYTALQPRLMYRTIVKGEVPV